MADGQVAVGGWRRSPMGCMWRLRLWSAPVTGGTSCVVLHRVEVGVSWRSGACGPATHLPWLLSRHQLPQHDAQGVHVLRTEERANVQQLWASDQCVGGQKLSCKA